MPCQMCKFCVGPRTTQEFVCRFLQITRELSLPAIWPIAGEEGQVKLSYLSHEYLGGGEFNGIPCNYVFLLFGSKHTSKSKLNFFIDSEISKTFKVCNSSFRFSFFFYKINKCGLADKFTENSVRITIFRLKLSGRVCCQIDY